MIRRKRRTERFVDWVSIPIPESYYNQIVNFLRETKDTVSVAEWVRNAIKEKLKREVGLK